MKVSSIMADQTVNDSEARQDLAREASIEILALAKMLGRERHNEWVEFTELLRGSLIRIHDLGCVVWAVTGDDGRETSEMHEVVFGVRPTICPQ
jgi:hypothetical protein